MEYSTKKLRNYTSTGPVVCPRYPSKDPTNPPKGLMCIPSHADDGAGAGLVQGPGAVALVVNDEPHSVYRSCSSAVSRPWILPLVVEEGRVCVCASTKLLPAKVECLIAWY